MEPREAKKKNLSSMHHVASGGTRSILDLHNDPLACQQIEHAPKDQRHQRAAQDDDIVRHRKIRRRKIDEERGGVHPTRNALSVTHRTVRDGKDDRGWKIPASHRVRGMFGIFQKRLAKVDRETQHALGRDRQRRLQCR